MVYFIPTIRQIINFYDRFLIQDYWNIIFNSGLNILTFYLFYFLFFPKNIQELQKTKTIIRVGVITVFVIISRYIISNIFKDAIDLRFFFNLCHTLSYAIQTTLFYVLMAGIVKLSMDWLLFQELKKELLLHKQQSELETLRAQVNPHFLFNTLNNIYSLAQNKSNHTPRAILMLSEMMRYTTKEVYQEFVPLSKEIQFINNFISLQKLRLKNPELINLKIKGNFENEKIAPLLLIVFIENAFKHGKRVSTKGININVSYLDNSLILKVENYFDPDTEKTNLGTGLKNVKKRLDILYKNNFSLNIVPDSEKKLFMVELNLRS